VISFFIPGCPKATQTGSIVRVRGRAFPIRRGTAWSAYCATVAQAHADGTPLEGPLIVNLRFLLPHPKDKRKKHPVSRPDAENLCKGLLDSWNGILWRDDSQIVRLVIEKRYATDGKVGVEVECWGQP